MGLTVVGVFKNSKPMFDNEIVSITKTITVKAIVSIMPGITELKIKLLL